MRQENTNENEGEGWLRPQLVVFTLLAEHLLDRDLPAVFAGSFIEVLERLGITEHATRATLARMHRRGLLDKQRHGRKSYLQMSPRCVAILEDGRERIWLRGAVNRELPDQWTLVTFSLPESWQKERYDLRVRLTWAGFAPLHNGVWIGPAAPDLSPLLEELGLAGRVHVFRARQVHPQDPGALVREAFDLDALAARHRDFTASFQPALGAEASDPLSLTLRLSTRWLGILRDDPRLPLAWLPADWPALESQGVFRSLHAQHRDAARAAADALLELAPA